MPAFPTFNRGAVLRAEQLRSSLPDITTASAPQTLSAMGSGTFDNPDRELSFRAEKNAAYEVQIGLLFSLTPNASTIAIYWRTLIDTTVDVLNWGTTTNAANIVDQTDARVSFKATAGEFIVHRLAGNGIDHLVWQRALITTTDVSDTAQLIWDMDTGVAGTLTRNSTSYMIVTRFA